MSIEFLDTVLKLIAISAAIVAALAGAGSWWTDSILKANDKEQITNLVQEIANEKPSIFSQVPIKINVFDGKFYTQKYRISIITSNAQLPIYLTILSKPTEKGLVERIGMPITNIIGTGIKDMNGTHRSYSDIEYTFKTNQPLKETDAVLFSTEKKDGIFYEMPTI